MATVLPKRSTKLQAVDLTAMGAGTFTSDEVSIPYGADLVACQAVFTRAGGGSTTDVYIQTSLDNGSTWIDIMQFALVTTTVTKMSAVRSSIAMAANVTPTDGGLSDNTILDGLLGDRLRAKTVIAGSYSGASSLSLNVIIN
jgi:hypothetical protein